MNIQMQQIQLAYLHICNFDSHLSFNVFKMAPIALNGTSDENGHVPAKSMKLNVSILTYTRTHHSF